MFIEELARSEKDTGDVYFVPAFSGLYAPYWETDARGVIVGLTNYTNKSHLCRATLEAVCFQSREVRRAGVCSVCVCVCVCGVVVVSLAQGLRSQSSSPTLAIFLSSFPAASHQPRQSTQL